MDILKDHPAITLGRWLKTARQSKGFVKRVFALQIGLTPTKYTEVEAGVVRWIGDTQRAAIVTVLQLTEEAVRNFLDLLKAAEKTFALSFSNVFSREDLEPIRFRFKDRVHRAREFDKETILNAVFADVA
jgi:transcriptional regulator with XRE-family HTH domain